MTYQTFQGVQIKTMHVLKFKKGKNCTKLSQLNKKLLPLKNNYEIVPKRGKNRIQNLYISELKL